MANPSLLTALNRLVQVGEQAGVSVDQMIRILRAGFSVEDVLRLIARRLEEMPQPETPGQQVHWRHRAGLCSADRRV